MPTSVIIPVFNGVDGLADAVASIRPQLCEGDELIIVDDGSTDGTADLIAGLGSGIVCIRQDNAGNAAARNTALRQAKGEFIAFLDHDDLWTEHRQQVLTEVLAADPSADVAVGRVDIAVAAGLPQPAVDHPRYVATHRPWQLDALLIRRDAFDRVGLFDERLRNAADADWFMRAREAGLKFVEIDQVTVIYRLHSKNLSRNVGDSREFLLQVFKSAIDRRRSR
jgi:glycosyltransferase involved in cell wall biosynthesis